MATVMVLDGPKAGRWYCVPENRSLVIGREVRPGGWSSTEMMSEGLRVEIRYDTRDGRYHAHALNPPGEAMRNGEPMPDFEPLEEGDQLQVGPTRVLFTSQNFIDDGQVQAFLARYDMAMPPPAGAEIEPA